MALAMAEAIPDKQAAVGSGWVRIRVMGRVRVRVRLLWMEQVHFLRCGLYIVGMFDFGLMADTF